MARTTTNLLFDVLDDVRNLLIDGATVYVPALNAIIAGAEGLVQSGMEPTDNQLQAFANLREMLPLSAAPATAEVVTETVEVAPAANAPGTDAPATTELENPADTTVQ